MVKKLFKTWIALVFFTIVAAVVSNYLTGTNFLIEVIVFISILKFIGIAFCFMELNKAHSFWKISTLLFLLLFFILIILI
jgi:hypothetical protein